MTISASAAAFVVLVDVTPSLCPFSSAFVHLLYKGLKFVIIRSPPL
jgi:hypothetical protein